MYEALEPDRLLPLLLLPSSSDGLGSNRAATDGDSPSVSAGEGKEREQEKKKKKKNARAISQPTEKEDGVDTYFPPSATTVSHSERGDSKMRAASSPRVERDNR